MTVTSCPVWKCASTSEVMSVWLILIPLCRIEHLDPPVLERVPAAVFGEMQPKVVIVSTPNSEFNVLFPDLRGFRHPDHRFEWTRSQFRDW